MFEPALAEWLLLEAYQLILHLILIDCVNITSIWWLSFFFGGSANYWQ
jgi:hypothetical protein